MDSLDCFSAPSPPHSIAFDRSGNDAFSHFYNRVSFSFEHDFCADPLFEWPSLLDLAGRHPTDPTYAYWSNGQVGIGDGWDCGTQHRYSFYETLLGIANGEKPRCALDRVEHQLRPALDCCYRPRIPGEWPIAAVRNQSCPARH
jgi:hypothetical protein